MRSRNRSMSRGRTTAYPFQRKVIAHVIDTEAGPVIEAVASEAEDNKVQSLESQQIQGTDEDAVHFLA